MAVAALKTNNYPSSISDEEKICYLRLLRTENIGPATLAQLLQRYGNAIQVIQAFPEWGNAKSSQRSFQLCSEATAYQEMEAHQKHGSQLVFIFEANYPQLLKAIPQAPPILSVYGQGELTNSSCFAIVGARNASLNGKRFAEKIASEMGQLGWAIVSGLARGIDTFAHQGALATGTIGVLAGGIDHIYPEENTGLYHEMAQNGLLISEAPFGAKPQAHFFPRRNRIISGLCQGLLVVEGTPKSGSLITAQNALEQGREIFAVPGSPLDPRAQGPNRLIQQGATLVQNTEDIANELPPPLAPIWAPIASPVQSTQVMPEKHTLPMAEEKLRDLSHKILENLSLTPVTLDQLIILCHISPEEILPAILKLELAGKVYRLPGNQIVLECNMESRK